MADTDNAQSFDAVVIGAGAGGMAAAAYLVKRGYRTLVVEREPQVGGRASTVDIDGFAVNTGAQIFELAGANKALFDEVGVPIRARKQKVPLLLRLGKYDLPMMSGPTGFVINKIVIAALGGASRKFGWFRPSEDLTLDQWLTGMGASGRTMKLVRNLTSAMFAAEPTDVSAQVFFDYLTKKGGMNIYGSHPDGGIGPWKDLAGYVERSGGKILLNATVTGIGVNADGIADSVTVEHKGGGSQTIQTRSVISNVGPVATGGLVPVTAWPNGYVEALHRDNYPGTLITINFATSKRIPNLKTLVFFGFTERLAYASYMSGPSPRLAPAGKHLYCVTSTPHPASSGFDVDAEVELLKQEGIAEFPQLADARILSVEVCAGDWPGQRAIPGRDWPNETPIPNVWNVGDGARPPMGAGQSGCVESARLAVSKLENAISPS